MDTETWHIHHNRAPDIRHEEYTIDELATILGVSPELLLHEIQTGDLKARVINHHTTCVERKDSIDWLTRRGHLY